MSKLMESDIQRDSLIVNLNIKSSYEEDNYELRVCFSLKTGEIVRVVINNQGSIGKMDWCVRKATGDFISHLIYDFAIGIYNKFLKQTFSQHIKSLSNKHDYDRFEVIEIINKIRKNYYNCTPLINII